jgi:hypothetical protein
LITTKKLKNTLALTYLESSRLSGARPDDPTRKYRLPGLEKPLPHGAEQIQVRLKKNHLYSTNIFCCPPSQIVTSIEEGQIRADVAFYFMPDV